MRLALAFLLALPAFGQVSVTVVQVGKPSARSLCRVELLNMSPVSIEISGAMISQAVTLGGFPVVSSGEEERAKGNAEAGVWRWVKRVIQRLTPVAIQGAAVLAVAKRYPIAIQGALTVAAVAVELIPDTPPATLAFLESSEAIIMKPGGGTVRFVRARASGKMAEYHRIIGADRVEPVSRQAKLDNSELIRATSPTFEFP